MTETIALSATIVALLLAVYILALHDDLAERQDAVCELLDVLGDIADGVLEVRRDGETLHVKPKEDVDHA